MTLADDLPPEACLEACTGTIEGNLVAISKNLPDVEDTPEELAKKYAILGKCLRTIKEYAKEALKSAQIGSDSAAFLLMQAGQHKTLDEFGDTQITITGPDGESVQTTMDGLEKAAKLAEDPDVVRRILDEGE